MAAHVPHIKESVGFSGTHHGMTDGQKERLVFHLEKFKVLGIKWFHHGDCVGADAEACEIARSIGFKIAQHPPTNDSKRAFTRSDYTYEPAEYLVRNRGIVNQSVLLIAAPKGPERLRGGTWFTIRYARTTAKPVYLI